MGMKVSVPTSQARGERYQDLIKLNTVGKQIATSLTRATAWVDRTGSQKVRDTGQRLYRRSRRS